MRARSIALLFVLWVALPAHASEASYLHYTVDEGLPSNEVYDVYEDSLGYIWFATDHGISRFDGYSFTNYSTNDGLVHNTIFGFYEDHRGWIWMRAFNGMLCYMRDGKIYPYAHNKRLELFLGSDFIQRYAFDKAGNLWFVPSRSDLGLFFQDAVTGEIKKITPPYGYNAFIRVFDSGEWLGGVDLNNGFLMDDPLNDSVIADAQGWYFKISVVMESAQRQTIFYPKTGASDFVFVYDHNLAVLENGKITVRQSFAKPVFGYYIDAGRQHWVAGDGFSKLEPGKNPASAYLYAYPGVDMLCDRMGNYWFGTLNNGVFLARDLQVSTLSIVGEQTVEELIHLGTYDSLLICLDQKGRFFQFPRLASGVDPGRAKYWMSDYAHNTFTVRPELNRLCVSNAYYTISNRGVDPGKKYLQGIVPHMTVGARDFYQTGDSMFVAGNSQWILLDSSDNLLYRSADEPFRGFCTAIAQSRDGHIWIGTSDGLYHFENGKTIPYRPQDSLFRQRVTDLAFGPGGELIVSTRGGGILIEDSNRVYEIRAKDGLASDQCGNICVDGNVVWICSNSGLTKMTMTRGKGELVFAFNRFGLQHGLPSEMINDALRSGDELFLATGHGLAWFNVHTFLFNVAPPPVYITSFLANSSEVSSDSMDLQWNERNISIGYLALLYKSPGLVHYRYKLEGYEEEWHYTTERLAHYFNLSPGEYRFVVSAMNENGIWNDASAVREFHIPAHYSETLWFQVLIVALIVSVLGVIIALYLRQQRTKALAAVELARAEQKALRAQMKPHFIFNALNSIQNFIINRDEDSANLYLSSFAQLMRRVLDHSKTAMITLEEEIDTMRIYLELEKLRFGNNFRFTIDIHNGVTPSVLMIPSLFIQPFVENAIWHGLQLQKNQPTLTIDFSIENNRLHCVVADNGIGRARAAAYRKRGHVSSGMKNVEDRIAALNATSREKISVDIHDLSDAEGNATGTKVEIWFPVIRNDE